MSEPNVIRPAAVQGALGRGLPVEHSHGTKVIDQALWGAKIGVGLPGVFGLLALSLASVGSSGIGPTPRISADAKLPFALDLRAGQASVPGLILRQGNDTRHQRSCMRLILSVPLGRAVSRFLYAVGASDAKRASP